MIMRRTRNAGTPALTPGQERASDLWDRIVDLRFLPGRTIRGRAPVRGPEIVDRPTEIQVLNWIMLNWLPGNQGVLSLLPDMTVPDAGVGNFDVDTLFRVRDPDPVPPAVDTRPTPAEREAATQAIYALLDGPFAPFEQALRAGGTPAIPWWLRPWFEGLDFVDDHLTVASQAFLPQWRLVLGALRGVGGFAGMFTLGFVGATLAVLCAGMPFVAFILFLGVLFLGRRALGRIWGWITGAADWIVEQPARIWNAMFPALVTSLTPPPRPPTDPNFVEGVSDLSPIERRVIGRRNAWGVVAAVIFGGIPFAYGIIMSTIGLYHIYEPIAAGAVNPVFEGLGNGAFNPASFNLNYYMFMVEISRYILMITEVITMSAWGVPRIREFDNNLADGTVVAHPTDFRRLIERFGLLMVWFRLGASGRFRPHFITICIIVDSIAVLLNGYVYPIHHTAQGWAWSSTLLTWWLILIINVGIRFGGWFNFNDREKLVKSLTGYLFTGLGAPLAVMLVMGFLPPRHGDDVMTLAQTAGGNAMVAASNYVGPAKLDRPPVLPRPECANAKAKVAVLEAKIPGICLRNPGKVPCSCPK
jgi:hypothetical protein